MNTMSAIASCSAHFATLALSEPVSHALTGEAKKSLKPFGAPPNAAGVSLCFTASYLGSSSLSRVHSCWCAPVVRAEAHTAAVSGTGQRHTAAVSGTGQRHIQLLVCEVFGGEQCCNTTAKLCIFVRESCICSFLISIASRELRPLVFESDRVLAEE